MVLTYYRIKVTDANVQKKCKKCLSGGGSCLVGGEGRLGSHKEDIHTEQVTGKERSTNVCVTEV